MTSSVKYEVTTNNVTQLSTKLGVDPKELYQAMIKKAKTDWIIPTVQCGIVFLMIIILYHFSGDWLTNFFFPEPRDKGLPVSNSSAVLASLLTALYLIGLVIFCVSFFDAMQKFIEGRINPEGAALEHLLNDH